MIRIVALLWSGLIVIGVAVEVRAAGDPEVGRAIAQRWCSNCHVVDAEAGGSDAAPAFAAIAANPTRTGDHLRAFLANPQFPMPNPQLTRREIEHVVAYVASLGPR
jgi:mono/diheme cytochrome c family protein